MSTILNELRELTKKIPNLQELAAEAARPAERPLSDVAYVYNGFDDVQLMYLGAYTYTFRMGHVTRIDSLPNHREIDTERTKGSSQLQWMTIPLKAESIANELINGRSHYKNGLVMFTEESIMKEDPIIDGVRVPKKLVEDADARGLAYKIQSIESFVVGREKAKSGIAGNKMRADGRVFEWMKSLRPDDEMFAEQHRKVDSNAMMATAVEKLVQMAEAISGTLPVGMPRRKVGESNAEYKLRVAEWAMAEDKDAKKE